MAELQYDDVTVAYDGRPVLADVQLTVGDGEVVALLGPSGSGKTSLLRVAAGFVKPTSGRVLLDGVDVTGVRSRDRGLGMVAQGGALLPSTDVEGNIELPLRFAGTDPDERRRRVEAETRAFGLRRLLRRRPRTLSVGERHTAATARAVVIPRKALLLDEPVVHLDPRTRAQVLGQVRTLQSGYGTTVLMATNDLGVASSVADRVAVIARRTVAQVARLDALRAAPAWLDVADLVAPAPLSRLTGRVSPGPPGGRGSVRTAAGTIPTWHRGLRSHRGPVVVGIGPRDIELDTPGGAGLTGTVRAVATTGPRRLVTVGTDAGAVVVDVEPPAPRVGEQVGLDVRRAFVADVDGRVLAVLDAP